MGLYFQTSLGSLLTSYPRTDCGKPMPLYAKIPIVALATILWLVLLCNADLPQQPIGLPEKDNYISRANRLLGSHPLFDGHNDFPMYLSFIHANKINHLDFQHINDSVGSVKVSTDIARLRQGRLTGQFWSVFFPCELHTLPVDHNPVFRALEAIDTIKRMSALRPDTFRLVRSTAEFERAFNQGKISSMLGVEGGHHIADSMATVRQFAELGVRYLTLTHNCHTRWAESCCDPSGPPPFGSERGLSTFGEKMVGELNRLGVFVDISHVSHATMRAVLRVTKAPVLFSHSSAYALCPIPRNVPDDVLVALRRTDGVVMVNFYSHFIRCDGKRATLEDVANHVQHIASVAGKEHVGLGSDFDGIDVTPIGLEDVSKYPNLIAELLRRGWTDEEVVALAGGNLLRIWKGIEKVRDQLEEKGVLPEEARIEDDDDEVKL